MKPRIYIDTSIVGGYFDEEFMLPTKRLFDRLAKREVIFVLSDLLELELIGAPAQVKMLLDNYPKSSFEYVSISEEANELAAKYIEEKVVGKTSIEDCRHIALATIVKVDILASWNFKHIVNLDRIKGYNSINMRFGYQLLEIRSPLDLSHYED